MKRVYDDPKLMYKVCDLYYNLNLTQEEIASTLSMSRPTVNKILQNAKDCGMIKFELINPVRSTHPSLKEELKAKLNLLDVVLVESSPYRDEIYYRLGKAGVQYLERTMKSGDVVGVSMGTSFMYIPKCKNGGRKYPNNTFIPLIGDTNTDRAGFHPNQFVMDLANAFGSSYHLLHIPFKVSDEKVAESIRNDKYINGTFEHMKKITIALLGIGTISIESTIYSAGYYDLESIKILEQEKYIGNILAQVFDRDGNPGVKHNSVILGFPIEDLRTVPHTIGFAFGENKISPILAAVKGGYVNTLITDEDTAKLLLASIE